MTKLISCSLILTCSLIFAEEIDFNRDIRPILSDKCFHCHGPDAANQRSDFRLDTREHALEDLGDYAGVVPGNLDDSEIHWRIRAEDDDDDVMPPADSNRSLSDREKDLLDAWIKQGAKYDLHWAFKQPAAKSIPASAPKNAIDFYIENHLKSQGLKASKPADLETLVRRASLTLTGLSPTPETLDKALANPDPQKGYQQAVEQFLASIDYAERQALRWLDAARFADTDGYQNDAERKNWPWRDWVIQAYDKNLPFDQFTIEQLAGDMLPDATESQILASAFNRNHRQNSEGGALAPEFYVENVIDRVETTSTVWLGLTMGCARCHDHKYDQLSQREFYQFFAYFNNIGERGIGKGVSANPTLKIGSPLVVPPDDLLEQLAAAQKAEAEVKRNYPQRLAAWIKKASAPIEKSKNKWTTETNATATVAGAKGGLQRQADGSWLYINKPASKVDYLVTIPGTGKPITAIRLEAIPHSSLTKPRQLAPSVNGNFVMTGFDVSIAGGKPVAIADATATFEQSGYPVASTIRGNSGKGWAVYNTKAETVSATFVLEEAVTIGKNQALEIRIAHRSNFSGHNVGCFKLHFTDSAVDLTAATTLAANIEKALRVESGKRTAADKKVLNTHFKTIDTAQKKAEKKRVAAERKLDAVGAGKVPVMVMREKTGAPMPSYLLDRGQYDAPVKSEVLPRAIPAVLLSGGVEDQPKDRLELAKWIVSKQNPLTARVIVNRIWQDHFGIGLVKTAEDFGVQGEVPTHLELLDWLAIRFVDSGWDVKALHRLIVNSNTYRQSSVVSPALQSKDPQNRLLARGPRYRLDGFSIRDNALHAAGLLDQRVGGPPVKPYQPEGLWQSVASNAGTRYRPAMGVDLYRKSIYTYWKRAVNPPRQLIFDAGGREACSVAVRRTNTPLQALALMNDVTFIEAARHVAEKAILANPDDDKRLQSMYRKVTSRQVEPKTLAILNDNLSYFKTHFSSNPEAAEKFLTAGQSKKNSELAAADHAAWTAVAHLILNLDKAITIE